MHEESPFGNVVLIYYIMHEYLGYFVLLFFSQPAKLKNYKQNLSHPYFNIQLKVYEKINVTVVLCTSMCQGFMHS